MTSMRLRFWDTFGIGLSGLCLIHCAVIPLLPVLFVIPLGAMVESELLHMGLLLLMLPTAVIALGNGYRRHRRKSAPILGAAGLAALVLGLALAGWLGESGEKWLTVCGGLVLAAAHGVNLRYDGLSRSWFRQGVGSEGQGAVVEEKRQAQN